jgi:hypothetical protein
MTWNDRESAHLEHRLGRPDQNRRYEYDLARFGLEADRVEQAFGDYARMVSELPTATGPRDGVSENQ